jgi:hypothetical protein
MINTERSARFIAAEASRAHLLWMDQASRAIGPAWHYGA